MAASYGELVDCGRSAISPCGRTSGLPTLVTNCFDNHGFYRFPENPIPQMTIKGLAEYAASPARRQRDGNPRRADEPAI